MKTRVTCRGHGETCRREGMSGEREMHCHFFFRCYLYATQRVAFIARLREICSVDITTNRE